jgi:hypothetical protein
VENELQNIAGYVAALQSLTKNPLQIDSVLSNDRLDRTQEVAGPFDARRE